MTKGESAYERVTIDLQFWVNEPFKMSFYTFPQDHQKSNKADMKNRGNPVRVCRRG